MDTYNQSFLDEVNSLERRLSWKLPILGAMRFSIAVDHLRKCRHEMEEHIVEVKNQKFDKAEIKLPKFVVCNNTKKMKFFNRLTFVHKYIQKEDIWERRNEDKEYEIKYETEIYSLKFTECDNSQFEIGCRENGPARYSSFLSPSYYKSSECKYIYNHAGRLFLTLNESTVSQILFHNGKDVKIKFWAIEYTLLDSNCASIEVS